MTFSTLSAPKSTKAPSAVRNKAASFVAIALGLCFIYVIGLSNVSALHNAAHDTRHSAAFPCH